MLQAALRSGVPVLAASVWLVCVCGCGLVSIQQQAVIKFESRVSCVVNSLAEGKALLIGFGRASMSRSRVILGVDDSH